MSKISREHLTVQKNVRKLKMYVKWGMSKRQEPIERASNGQSCSDMSNKM